MRVLAEMGLLLVLGLALAWLVGLRSDGVFIAGLLLAVSVAGLVEWLRPAQWSWVLCTAYLVIALAVPSWCAFMPLIAYDTARLPALASTGARAGARTAASGRSPSVSQTAASRRSLADAMRSAPWLSAAARWIWVLPLIALWFARGTDRLQTLVMTLVALLGFVLGRARASSDEARRALLHAQDRARESSRATRSRIADIDEERAQSIRMATLGERTRIAREIHDNVGHLLTRAIMQAQAGKTVAKATNDTVAAQGFATLGATLDDAMTMVRRSVHDLEDDGTDFAAQIDDAVTSFDGIFPGFAVTLANDIAKAPAPVSRCFATVIREALSNVVHHSAAREASVTLRDFPAFWQLVIQDPGPAVSESDGSRTAAARPRAMRATHVGSRLAADGVADMRGSADELMRGMGLADIESRVRALGGTGFETVREAADALADAFASMALDERANELYMSGTSHLAHSRSLTDLAPLFDALEEQVVLMKLMSNLSEETNASGVGVAIGSEMHTPGLLHASVVSSGYGRSGAAGEPAGNDPVGEPETESETESQTNDTEPIAFVGSIGPTHMDYAATMAAVRAVARYLTAFLSEGRTQD